MELFSWTSIVPCGFETGLEDGFAFGVQSAAVKTMALLDMAPQMATVKKGAGAAGLLARERQNSRVVVTVSF